VFDPLDLRGRLADLPLPELSVLDMGCGECDSLVSRQVLELPCAHLTSMDAHAPALERLRGKPCAAARHTSVQREMQAARELLQSLRPDVTLLLDALEHLEASEASALLDQVERRTGRRVLIWLPLGPCPQEEYGGNPYQRHRSTWSAQALQARGYVVECFPGFHRHFSPPVDAGWAVWRPAGTA